MGLSQTGLLNLSIASVTSYRADVPIVRILIDGYSLLHSWPELAPGKPRHSEAARDELIRWLTYYRDITRIPITVIFDGAGAPRGAPKATPTPELEVLFSRAGQTADAMIERAAHRLRQYGEVLVVTDDHAERDTITSLGGMVSTCAHFVQSIQNTLDDLERDLKHRNRRENSQFKKAGQP